MILNTITRRSMFWKMIINSNNKGQLLQLQYRLQLRSQWQLKLNNQRRLITNSSKLDNPLLSNNNIIGSKIGGSNKLGLNNKIDDIKDNDLKIDNEEIPTLSELADVKPLYETDIESKNHIKSKDNIKNIIKESKKLNNITKNTNTTTTNIPEPSEKFELGDNIPMEFFFDSFKVVQEFKRSGFSDKESVLLMKYTYHVLEEKLKWINLNYSPRVDLENEAYLFEAAHSELLFEVTNSREISLMDLTNAIIILKRSFNNLNDETIAQIKLNDDIIKMESNQFKHENNLHQKSLNLKNSDLNSRILSDMVSGLKSEIETFRWQLTRAGILSITIMAILIMGVWNLNKRLALEIEEENQRSQKGPLLIPVHDQTDEELHDYEADWDERVTV